MPIPERKKEGDYHYHVYDYPGSKHFTAIKNYGNFLFPKYINPHKRSEKYYSLLKDMEALRDEADSKNIGNVELQELGMNSYWGRKILALKFGGSRENSSQVLLTGGVHAREWIGVEIPYLIAEYLIKHYDNILIENLVDGCEIWVVPMVNPDGHLASVISSEGRCAYRGNKRPMYGNLIYFPTPRHELTSSSSTSKWIKVNSVNRTGKKVPVSKIVFRPDEIYYGIDCNRNFDVNGWGDTTTGTDIIPKDPTTNYCGPYKASEFETEAIQLLIKQLHNLGGSIDYHSFHGLIIYPESAENPSDTTRMAKFMSEHTKYDGKAPYRTGTTKDLLEYDAYGACTDYSFERGNCQLAFTVELDPQIAEGNAVINGFPGFSSLSPDGFEWPEKKIKEVFEKNITAALCLIHNASNRTVRNQQVIEVGNVGNTKKQAPCCPFKAWNEKITGNQPPPS